MPSVTVERLEERWTPTKIETAFSIRSLPRVSKSGGISIDFPLLNLGWTFALLLTPAGPGRPCKWIPAALSFRQHASAIHWENTSIHAELTFRDSADGSSGSAPLVEMDVNLANTPSSELPLEKTCILSPSQSHKVWLTVTISQCPFSDGLFEARFGPVDDAKVQVQLAKWGCDRFLNQSLTTGQKFQISDVKFLAFSTRSASGNTGKPLPSHASLSVVGKHINLTSSLLGEDWRAALAPLGDTRAKRVREVLCPEDHEYEPDSDFEDEALSCEPGGELVSAVPEGQQSECGSETPSSSLSFFELEGAGDQNLQLEELIRDAKDLTPEYEREVWVRFVAHRTWHAFLWYCYTGDLHFGKLRSQVKPGGHLRVTPIEGGPPTCSPKSMYRLADLLGNEDLKVKALVAIKDRVTATNVLDEAFSIFTSRYPAVREIQLSTLIKHGKSPDVKEAFLKAMEKYGSIPHAKPMLSALFDNLVA